MSTTIEKSAAVNLTVKLSASERERLKAIASSKHRSTHYLMKEAIQNYLEKAEGEQRFIEAALESRLHYKKTGLHVTQDEFSTWVDALKTNPKAQPPVCHA